MEQESGRQRTGKSWLAQHRIVVAAGIAVSVIAAGTFVLMGLAAFKAGTPDVGVGYLVTAAVAPVAIMVVATRYWTD